MPIAHSVASLRTSEQWAEYFRHNQQALAEIPWELGIDLTEAEHAAVAKSIQEFQLGESSEGRHLITAGIRYSEESGDAGYITALRLFINEEHRHSADLGRAMDLAGIARIGHVWLDSVFRWLRRGAGLEQSIAVVLSAEIIARIYYAALRDATRSRVLHRLCEQILRDEIEHIRFQCERLAILRQHHSRWHVGMVHALHRAFFALTCLVVWRRHRRALLAGGFGFIAFWRSAGHEMRQALRMMDPRNCVQAVQDSEAGSGQPAGA